MSDTEQLAPAEILYHQWRDGRYIDAKTKAAWFDGFYASEREALYAMHKLLEFIAKYKEGR